MNSKPFYKSKTVWIATIAAALAWFAPGVATWVGQNPEISVTILGIVFTVLRKVSHGKIDLGVSSDN